MGKKIKQPAKPNVRLPTVWSWAVQQIVADSSWQAFSDMLEEKYGILKGFAYLSADVAFKDLLYSGQDPVLTKEYYERTLFFIAKAIPGDGASYKGLPVDRAESRLRMWLDLYDN